MELNTEGFYKKPRVLSGMKFLSHITETRKCGNRMPVYFPHKGTIDVIDWRYEPLMECDSNPVTFLTQWAKDDVYVQCIDDWEFVQYRPNTQWTAIKLEKKEDEMLPLFADRYKAEDYVKLLLNSIYGKNYFTLEFEFTPGLDGKPGYYRAIRKEPMVKDEKKLSPIDFQDFYIKETFDNLKEVVVLYNEQFYTLMGMMQNLAKPGNYFIYLKRWMYDRILKVEITSNQKFIYQKNSKSWLVDPVAALYTEVNDIKMLLRADEAKWVYVSGVKKKLKRVSEISDGLLHFVFVNGDQIEHFYSTKEVRLRVREGKISTEYLIDHVKRMHV